MEQSIDYRSPIDDEFQDPNWDSEIVKSNKEVIPQFVHVEATNKINPFNISNIEVTQKLYEKVMGTNPSKDLNDNLPVESVSWYEAIEFCNKLSLLRGFETFYNISDNGINFNIDANGYRLPFKREWIFAAVGGLKKDSFKYAGSDILSDVGWFNANSSCKIHIVGQKKENAIGLYDMSGNIWEWTNDDFEQDKVACGGCFSSTLEECMILNQGKQAFNPSTESSEIGFRLVRTLFH